MIAHLHRCTPVAAPAESDDGLRGCVRTRVAIDIHAHMLVPEVEDFVRELAGGRDGEQRRASVPPATRKHNAGMMAAIRSQLTVASRRLEDMDRMGIDRQVVTPSPTHYYYSLDREPSAHIVRLQNEAVAKLCSSEPRRFLGMGTVSLQFPDLACAQLQELARAGMLGVQISTQIGERELADPAHEEFWSEAERLELAIFIHPLGTTLGARVAPYYLTNLIGHPLDTAIALSHIIFSGLLDRRPALHLCAAHGGGYLPAYFGRTEHAYKVRPECRELAREPREYLRRMYFDSLVYSPRALRHLADEVGADRVVIGSDYPFDMGESDPLAMLRAEFTEAERSAILRENALRLLRLDR